jgi:hypothetical protein
MVGIWFVYARILPQAARLANKESPIIRISLQFGETMRGSGDLRLGGALCHC